MDKRLLKARAKIKVKEFFKRKTTWLLGLLLAIVVGFGLILLSWHLEGRDIVAIFKSPVAIFWYVILGVFALLGVYIALTSRGKKE